MIIETNFNIGEQVTWREQPCTVVWIKIEVPQANADDLQDPDAIEPGIPFVIYRVHFEGTFKLIPQAELTA